MVRSGQIGLPTNDKTPKNIVFRGLQEATLTGLEPATTGSTVRYSNQLSYSALNEMTRQPVHFRIGERIVKRFFGSTTPSAPIIFLAARRDDFANYASVS